MDLRSPKENLDLYFRHLAQMYDREAFPLWEGAAQFFLEDGEPRAKRFQ